MPGKRGREARDATRAPRRASRKAREAREPGARGEGGGGKALSRPGDPTAPVPRRGEDARSRARSRSTRVAAHRRHRAEGRGGRGRGRRSPLSLQPRTAHTAASPPAPPPPEGGRRGDSPGQGHTADGRRAPSASVHHTRPRGAGDAGRRGHAATGPRWARPGTRPALGRAHLSGWARRGEDHESSPSSSTRRRRRTGGGETGSGSGPRRAREARHTRARPRGAADGERTEADGQTEKGTDGVRPREANATERAVEAGWPRATARGRAQGDPWAGETRVSRRGPPRDLTARGLPAQGRSHGTPGTTDWRPRHPHGGSRPPPPTHTREPQPAGENALPPRTGGPPPSPTRARLPRPAPPRGRHRPTEAGGRHPREARPARSQTGDGSAGRSHARDEEERPAAAGRGRQARTAGAAGQGRGRRPGTRKTPGTRPGHQENQRGVPPPPTHEGGPATRLGRRPVPAIPGAGPHDPAPPPGPGCRPAHLPPSVLDRSVFHLA